MPGYRYGSTVSNKRRKGHVSTAHANKSTTPAVAPAGPPPTSESEGPFRKALRSPRTRLSVGAAFLAILLVAYLVGQKISVARELDLSVRADQGRTSLALAPELDAVSPGCGCADPHFGELAWYGMSIPSEGFELSVASKPAQKIDRHLWALEALAPEQDVVDWYQSPAHSLEMNVVAERDEHRVSLFSGRISHLVLATSSTVTVEQSQSNPYAALMPAANGITSFDSEAGARPDEGGSVQIHSSVPARPSAYGIFRPHFHETTAVAQRGPMIDVLGPTIHLRIENATGTTVRAGLRTVDGIKRHDSLDILLKTPYSIRLIPHPVQLGWWAKLPETWSHILHEAKYRQQSREQAAFGPEAQGRFVLAQPLPAYSVRLANVHVPEKQIWSRFAARSESKSLIPPMLGSDSADRYGFLTLDYGLPPVTPAREIGVFGHITQLTANSLDGTAAIGSHLTSINSGQITQMHSQHGLSAGRYRLTPLVSEGEPTELAEVTGDGHLSVDSTVLTNISWLRWLLGAIALTVLGLIVHEFLSWIRFGTTARNS